MLVILKSVVLASVAGSTLILLAQMHPRLSVSVLILNGILLLLLVGGSRVALRLFAAWLHGQKTAKEGASRVVIYGAGARGDLLIRRLLSEGTHIPVGFLDDDLSKAGRRMHGIHIYRPSDLHKVTRKHGIAEVLVSTAKIPEEKVSALGVAFQWAFDGDAISSSQISISANEEKQTA